MKRIYFVMILFLGLESKGMAQSFSPFNIQLAGPAEVTGTPSNSSPDASIGYYEIDFGAAKVKAAREARAIFTFRYNHINFDHKNWPADLPKSEPLHNIQFSTILQGDPSPDWRITLVMTPGLASDFAVSSGASEPSVTSLFSFFKAFHLSTTFVIARKRSANHAAGFGVNFREDRNPSLLPLLQIYWNGADRLTADILAPAYARIWYAVRQNLQLGLLWRAAFSTYVLSGSNQNRSEGMLRRKAFSLASAIRVPLKKQAALQLEGGLMFRHHLFYTGEDVLVDLGRSQFAKLGLVLTSP